MIGLIMKSRSVLPLLLLLFLSLSYFLTKEWIRPSHTLLPLPTPLSPPSSPSSQDPDTQLAFDFFPFVRLFKSGRVERLIPINPVTPGLDPSTHVLSADVLIDPSTPVSARLYLAAGERRQLPVLVYFHGGAFVIGSAFSPNYHLFLNALAALANLVVVSVEYRLAPEHPLPAAYDDSWAALKWVVAKNHQFLSEHGDLGRLFVAGDSAGGNIAHNVAMRAGREELGNGLRITGLLLLNPYFWGKASVEGETRDLRVRERMESTWAFVCEGKYGIDHPFVDPTAEEEWGRIGCKRVLVTVAGWDEFRPRGVAYVEGLKRVGFGGEVELHETEEEPHAYFLSRLGSEKARREVDVVAEFLNRP